MIIKKENHELVSDLIDFRIGNGEECLSIIKDLYRYGFEGYLYKSNDDLIKEALKMGIYGEDVKEIELIQ